MYLNVKVSLNDGTTVEFAESTKVEWDDDYNFVSEESDQVAIDRAFARASKITTALNVPRTADGQLF